MARKRMIDPTIWEDEDFGSLSPMGKLLFIGIFSNADDEGRIRANPSYLKSTIFMYDDMENSDVRDYLKEVCQKMKSVKYYVSDGKEVIQLLKWEEYQKQHKDRIQPSTLPPIPDDVTDNVGQVTDNVGVSKDKISKDKLILLDEKSSSFKKKVNFSENQEKYHRITNHLEEILKTKITNYPKQAVAIKKMFSAGYTEDQIIKTIDHMANRDEFFIDKGFDLVTVMNQIPRYKAMAEKQKKGGDKYG